MLASQALLIIPVVFVSFVCQLALHTHSRQQRYMPCSAVQIPADHKLAILAYVSSASVLPTPPTTSTTDLQPRTDCSS